MYLKFLSKKDDYKKELYALFDEFIKRPNRKEIITINTKEILYRVQASDILYVYFGDRKSNIITSYGTTMSISKPLNDIFNLVDDRYMYSHKSCFVNIDKIISIDKKKRIIYFSNDYSTDIVSLNYLRQIINKLK